ncbi:MAG: hypothetical protein FJ270_08435 [Planctomycetes bacterium]|nr:hypothetical protein [Planctomycetota bacterium]
MKFVLGAMPLLLALAVAIRVHAADPPRGPGSVVEATMMQLSTESAAIPAPDDEIGRELIEVRRTWRGVAIELLRASSTEPWSSQASFVTGMRMVDARGDIDTAMARALALPRSDADVVRLAAAARAFTERGSTAVHALAADDPARVDAAVLASLAGLADALAPFAADDRAATQPDADLWPTATDSAGSTRTLERLVFALGQLPAAEPWAARATAGASMLRQAAAIAAFRPQVDAMADAALGSIRLLRTLDTMSWLDQGTIRSLRTACETALAELDRSGERERVTAELRRLDAIGVLLDDLSTLCAGRGGRPPLGVDGAARCVRLVTDGDRSGTRTRAAMALASAMRVQADALPGSMPALMGSILRRSSKDRTALVQWLADGAGIDPPEGTLAAAERSAEDLSLLERSSTIIGRAASLGAKAQQAALRTAERAGDGLKLDRTRDAARSALAAMTQRLDRWIELPGERELRKPQSAMAMVAGPLAARLAARIDRTRAGWAASLGRPEQAALREMELLERTLTQADRLSHLGLDDADMLATSAALARWAAWSPSADGVAVTLAPLRPRILLVCTAAAEGEWDECERTLEAVERELPLAEFVSVVQSRIGASLPRVEPTVCALIRSLGTPTHDGSWIAVDRARLATLARAWRELRHATVTGSADQTQACAAVAAQVARDLLDSLAAIGPDTVAP